MTAQTHRVQGLANDEVVADWPAISPNELHWLGTRYRALSGHVHIDWHSPRPMSAAALITTGEQTLFVKRHHHSVRNAATLSEEHRFMAHLRQHDVPVVEVVHADDGNTAVEHAHWTYEVHRPGAGADLYRDVPSWTPVTNLAHAHAAGAMLAQLHNAASGYRAPQRTTHMLVARDDLLRAQDPVRTLRASLSERPALARYLHNVHWQDDLRADVVPWHSNIVERIAAEPALWGHNDWHASNLLWDAQRGGVATVFDFGLCSPTSAVFDLATAIERNAIAWLDLEQGAHAVHIDTALALITGYRTQRTLTTAQVHLLADLLPVVHLDFALSEVEYFNGPTACPANAEVAYRTFLLGHARWFHSAPGQLLLKALHTAA